MKRITGVHPVRATLPALLLLGLAGTIPAPAGDERIDFDEIIPEQERAIERGLAYLAKGQNERDGSWGAGSQESSHQVATTALAGLAMLAHGDTPTRGKYAPNLRKAVDFLVKQADPTGVIRCRSGSRSIMHEHGYAMLFLGQVYGMCPSVKTNEEIRSVLRNGVRLTTRSQSKLGGWNYIPDASDHEGSITVTQIEGLRSARNAGIEVGKETISRAIGFMKASQNPDGSIMYKPGMNNQSITLTAAGVAVMYNAGEFNQETNEIVRKCLAILDRTLKGESGIRMFGGHGSYGHFYMSQAAFLAGPRYWNAYFPRIRRHLVETQAGDGSWGSQTWGGQIGPYFDTAVACFILEMPYRFLPILQK